MWQKYLNEVLFDSSIILALLIVATIGKGAYDLFTSGHLYLWKYPLSHIHEMLGSVIFFAIVELISLALKHQKKS